jgi:hypothetical protein
MAWGIMVKRTTMIGSGILENVTGEKG